MMMGKIISAWLLFWQAGVAKEKLAQICSSKGVDINDGAGMQQLIKENKDVAFYDGKIKTARFFIKHVLPEIEGTIKSIKSEDLSIMEIAAESFAS
jgi:hypothetical protein